QKHGPRIPTAWRATPIRELSPEIALEVIGEHRLLPPAELRSYWQASFRGGFTLDFSCILFDGERPFGAFLARRMGDVCYGDVRVMREQNALLRSLGNLFMMRQMMVSHARALQAGKAVPFRWLRFRAGESEHRETARLALRMGGRELAQAHQLV